MPTLCRRPTSRTRRPRSWATVLALALLLGLGGGCGGSGSTSPATHPDVDRESRIPADAVKVTPATDLHPPVLHPAYAAVFHDPVPMPYPVNTAGGEDSPYVLPDGRTFYFFFTPDVRVPAEQQVHDQVTGVWVTRRTGEVWSVPERVWLQDPGRLSLDGAQTVVGDTMIFASAREGYTGLHLFTARLVSGVWSDWTYAGDRLHELEVGELHVVGGDLYFHSKRAGGHGGFDLWQTSWVGGTWAEPVNLAAVNTTGDDGWPYVTEDGQELWLTRWHGGAPALWRSEQQAGTWQTPELVVSSFAAEPSLDGEGNLYFAHHFFENDEMIEADIYVCRRR